MKQKILSVPFIFLLAIALVIASCSKGPAGAAGAAGAQGPAGPTGSTGATGATGTANVIYSPWLNVTFASRGDTTFAATIPAPHLSDSILNTGMVKVYWNAGSDAAGGQFVLSLPINEPFLFYTDTTFTTKTTLIANDYFYLDTIGIISNYDISSVSSGGFNYQQFRYVIVPGGTTGLPATINGIKKPLDWNNYNEVKQYFGIKD